MKRIVLLVIVCCAALASHAQTSHWQEVQNRFHARTSHLPPRDSFMKRIRRTVTTQVNEVKANTQQAAKAHREEIKNRPMHVGWEDGKVWEFQNAYTISRHEWRLNLLGPSSFGITNKLEVKSYIQLVLAPNVSFKYRFLEKGQFTAAVEPGASLGGLPVAGAMAILLPGGAVGGGTVGIVSYSDVFVKLYASWHPTQKFTFSLRAGASHIKASYTGLGGFAAIGGNGEAVGFIPFSVGLIKTNWIMAGFEADYVLNQHNAFVLRSSIGKLHTTGIGGTDLSYTSSDYLAMPSLSWNRAWRHVHLTAGIYGAFDPPSFTMVRNSKIPVGPFADVYWVLNNRVKSKIKN